MFTKVNNLKLEVMPLLLKWYQKQKVDEEAKAKARGYQRKSDTQAELSLQSSILKVKTIGPAKNKKMAKVIFGKEDAHVTIRDLANNQDKQEVKTLINTLGEHVKQLIASNSTQSMALPTHAPPTQTSSSSDVYAAESSAQIASSSIIQDSYSKSFVSLLDTHMQVCLSKMLGQAVVIFHDNLDVRMLSVCLVCLLCACCALAVIFTFACTIRH